jgi:hypothetical protein
VRDGWVLEIILNDFKVGINPLLGPLEGVGPGYIDFTLIVI